MGEATAIEWTDATFNPWWGCTNVSPACDHCYAESAAKRYGHDGGQYDPADGDDPEVWAMAKEGDLEGTRDELVDGLLAMEERGWIRLDWDADPPEPKIINAAAVVREEAP